MSGRTEGGASRKSIGLFPLAGDTFALGIALPYGSMPADKLIALTETALTLGTSEIRLAPGRALLFLSQPPAANQPLQNAATTLGFVTAPTDPRTRIAACPGAPACASGRIATRDIAETIAAENADLTTITDKWVRHGVAQGQLPPHRTCRSGFSFYPARSRSSRSGPVAQWLEPTAHNGLVAGSSPAGPTSTSVMREGAMQPVGACP